MNKESWLANLEGPLSRAAGAPPISGNRVRLLKDAAENYPAWMEAIRTAQKWVHFETYIVHEDDTGHQFADLLAAKAREGVRVRLLSDWFGSIRNTSRRSWRLLMASGVDVRCFNRLHLDSPFGWTSRDHRKLIAIDGGLAYVTGLCVGQQWVGNPSRGLDPWRDTGMEIAGPAVAALERSFAETWAAAGETLPASEFKFIKPISETGGTTVRVIGSAPNMGGVYRLDQLIATLARKYIWLSDAYFIGSLSYVQALRAAARSGVDVRLLMPGTTDVPVMRAISRSGLRPLLEAGVRVFEWDGSMMHAKTAVVDGEWARVGSTNLNILSWLGNWELDVIVEEKAFASQMEELYLDDLAHSTEIVLHARRRKPVPTRRHPGRRRPRAKNGSASRTAAGVLRLSFVVSAAITNRRELGPAETVIMGWGAALLLLFALVVSNWPRALSVPVAVLSFWIAISLAIRAYKLRKQSNR